jgi:iron complex transport system substrate-binding protein
VLLIPALRLALLPLCTLVALFALVGPAAAAKDQRIVALTPFAANVLADLGVKPVGIGEGLGGEKHLDRSLRRVPRLPLSHASNGPNLEQLVELDPDLMLSERTWAAGHEAVEDLGIEVRELDPYRIAAAGKSIRAIGRLVDRKQQAKRLAERTAKQIRKSRRGISSRPRVLMILGVGETPYAFLPNSWGGDLATRAGANLITDGLESEGSELLVSGGYAQLSDEEILIRNPDVIIAVPHGRAEDVDEIAARLREDETFASTNAGANDRIYVTLDNALLQAGTKVARTIRKVRREFLLNL